MAAGTAAVVCQDASAVGDFPCAVVEDSRAAVGPLAQAIRNWPVRKLTCLAVTGTNGKTTVTCMLREILRVAGYDPALLGTIRYETGRRCQDAGTTTPDAVSLAEMTEEMVAAGKTHLVMEVSSHALDQRRTAGLDFRVAVFTNLSGDHLDYHGAMENYLAAKRRLFESLGADAEAVLNRDDAWSDRFAAATTAKLRWYGLSPAADVQGRIDRIDEAGSTFELSCNGKTIQIATPMIGRHNVQNCLAAAAAALALEVDLPTIAKALGQLAVVPGRLQRINAAAGFQVFVDYAHTDDALRNVLSALRPVVAGRILVVFGCGGDRDQTKRPRMARVAEELADRIIVTSDNPRTERPQDIIEQILAGLSDAGRAKTDVQVDRRTAIEHAIEQARAGDAVLIAGKGHETYQIIGHRHRDFDDAKVAEQILRRREPAA